MTTFQVFGNLNIKNKTISIERASSILADSLRKYYINVSYSPTGLNIDSSFKPWYCFCQTKANINLSIGNDQLLYRVDGTCSLSKFTYLWLILGLLPIEITKFFLIWVIFFIIEFIINKDKPKKLIEEAFKVLEFDILKISESANSNKNYDSFSLALKEYEGADRNRDLYEKLFTENQGFESKVKAKYIEIRVAEINSPMYLKTAIESNEKLIFLEDIKNIEHGPESEKSFIEIEMKCISAISAQGAVVHSFGKFPDTKWEIKYGNHIKIINSIKELVKLAQSFNV